MRTEDYCSAQPHVMLETFCSTRCLFLCRHFDCKEAVISFHPILLIRQGHLYIATYDQIKYSDIYYIFGGRGASVSLPPILAFPVHFRPATGQKCKHQVNILLLENYGKMCVFLEICCYRLLQGNLYKYVFSE